MKLISEKMLKRYFDLLHLVVKDYEPIIHEESISSSLFKVVLRDNSYAILKIPYNEKKWRRECFFLKRVKEHILVPEIFDTINPTENIPGAILMEYIEGAVIPSSYLMDSQAIKMGELMAILHNISCECYGDTAIGQFLSSDKEGGITMLSRYFEESFKECEDEIDGNLLKKIEKYFYSQIKEIRYLDGPCIVHGDFKPGNILFYDEKITGLIDWESSKQSFAEEDFTQMQYLVWEKNPKTKKAFLEGYRSVRKIPDFEKIMPLLRLCKALGAIGFTIERKTFTTSHKFIFDQNIEFLHKFFVEQI